MTTLTLIGIEPVFSKSELVFSKSELVFSKSELVVSREWARGS